MLAFPQNGSCFSWSRCSRNECKRWMPSSIWTKRVLQMNDE